MPTKTNACHHEWTSSYEKKKSTLWPPEKIAYVCNKSQMPSIFISCHMAHWYRKTLSDIVAKKKTLQKIPKVNFGTRYLKSKTHIILNSSLDYLTSLHSCEHAYINLLSSWHGWRSCSPLACSGRIPGVMVLRTGK